MSLISGFPPLFGHQYCQTWIDFRGLQDSYMSRRGIDYSENNRRAVYAQREYAIANPHGWKDYSGRCVGRHRLRRTCRRCMRL